jgi:hypothetical protein
MSEEQKFEVLRWMSSGLLRRAVWQKFTDVSEVLAASIIRVMQAPLKHQYTSTKLHDAITQKTAIFMPAAVRT